MSICNSLIAKWAKMIIPNCTNHDNATWWQIQNKELHCKNSFGMNFPLTISKSVS